MLITILAWAYISILSWVYGFKLYQWLGEERETISSLHFSIICLLGLSFLTTLGSYLSLYTGLNDFFIHSTILLLALLLSLTIPKQVYQKIRDYWPRHNLTLLAFLLACISVVLVMGVWHIKHPDTLDYHSIIIESIKDKGLEKGFAQQNLRYGLQSNWFVSCALFSFDLMSFQNLTFLNTCVLLWLFFFVVYKIWENSFLHSVDNDHFTSLMWIFFLVFAFWDYNQLRLTATSASPDFTTALYILVIIFLFNTLTTSKRNLVLLIFLIAITFTQKLFSFPLIILLIYLAIVLIKKYPSALFLALTIFIITLTPFLLRNYFTSGHILYPSTFPWISKPVWQITSSEMTYLREYIKAYARVASSEEPTMVKQVVNAPWQEWAPVWWNLRSTAQKVMFLIIGIVAAISLYSSLKYRVSLTFKQVIIFITSLGGLITWFILAPDPRFATAFLISLLYILSDIFIHPIINIEINGRAINICLNIFTVLLAFYLFYRLYYFFDLVNIVYPYNI